ncbi:sensor histidine kinase [Pseudalkalibacillus caeni]|uniref:histidine kinase n=1 Tax=Exobacillus caeni TaxID=2574798 RepID=A0A5R9FB83_9BACL|nr:sensor histidine kinase [Pseudalkalibacillus caeni]TLS38143.1 HAMP domain-containing histidine kinase [Pseudalkalibacillus caeni]
MLLPIVESVLFQVSIVFFPIFLYHILFSRDQGIGNKTGKILFGILCSVLTVIVMTFPIVTYGEHIVDFRIIPVMIAILYGGVEAGLITVITMFTYRFYLGGNGVFVTFLAYSFIIIAFFLVKPFQEFDLKKKLLSATVLTFVISFSAIASSFYIYETSLFFIMEATILFAVRLLLFFAIIYMIESVTARFRMESELQRTEKLQVVSEIAASVAHEIRNPMTSTRGFLQLLSHEGLTGEKRNEFIRIAITELDRAELIINDYLSLAKPQAEEITEIPLRSTLSHILNILSPYATINNVKLKIDLEGEASVVGNSARFNQSLINLVKNAIEACKEQGEVKLLLKAKDELASIQIIDNGVGMEEEQVSRIGTAFYSTKEKGTGLGLMVCYRVIDAMGGKIKVKSERNKGTAFTITLPNVTYHQKKPIQELPEF